MKTGTQTLRTAVALPTRYTIYCAPDKVAQVLGWFARGIRVKVDHALDRLAGDCFMPADVDTAPTWGYGEADAVLPADCPAVFSVTAYVEQEFRMPKDVWIRRQYQKACRAQGWKVWNRNYGAHGYAWFRSKEVPVYVAGEGHKTPIEMRDEYIRMALTPPLTPLDLLRTLEDSVLVGKGIGDQVAIDAEREALRRGDPIPRWILSRAQYYLDGYLMEYGHNSPAGPTRSGNSTWMFDPSPDAKDPVNRKGDK